MSTGDAAQATILVVDDDPEILSMLRLRLTRRGYRVLTAADGNQALEVAGAELPALVVLDVMMPGMKGWEVALALRQNERTRAIKIVILTAIGEQLNEMTSPLYGADAYMDKPFRFQELENVIAELLGSREAPSDDSD